jgi:hypothetical protein
MASITEFEEIFFQLGVLQSRRATPLLLDGCDAVDV